MASAERLRFDRPIVLHPAEMVNVMDVEVIEASSAGPKETVEIPNLPKQLVWLARPLGCERRARRPMHPVTAHENNIAEFAILNALVQFLQPPLMARHQSDADFEVLRLCVFGQFQHFAARRAIGGQGLLHEYVQALGDSVGEMDPAKR